MQKRKLTKQQKRLINENPNIQAGKLAKLIGCNVRTIHRNRVSKWSYEGVGIPFLKFDCVFKVIYKKKYIASSAFIENALNVVVHLIWCIENNMFNKPRIEHPYLENLKFGV